MSTVKAIRLPPLATSAVASEPVGSPRRRRIWVRRVVHHQEKRLPFEVHQRKAVPGGQKGRKPTRSVPRDGTGPDAKRLVEVLGNLLLRGGHVASQTRTCTLTLSVLPCNYMVRISKTMRFGVRNGLPRPQTGTGHANSPQRADAPHAWQHARGHPPAAPARWSRNLPDTRQARSPLTERVFVGLSAEAHSSTRQTP